MNIYSKKNGQTILVAIIFFLALSLSITIGVVGPASGEATVVRDAYDSKQSYATTEAGVEDLVYRVKNGMAITTPLESVTLGTTSASVSVVDESGAKRVMASSSVSGAVRKINTLVYKGDGISFHYGIQVGSIGATMESNSALSGNIYTNGSLIGSSNSAIIGSALAVGTISSPDPTVSGTKSVGVDPLPLPEFDVAYWKAQANINNDPYVGNYTIGGNDGVILGPRKIQGNFNINSNASVTLRGPLHVTGDINFNSNSDVYLDEAFGSLGTVVVADGIITFNGNANIHTTHATPKGYILFVSLATGTAVQLNSNSNTALILAPNGNVVANSNAHATSIAAQGLVMRSNATITYDSGLSDARFTTGPSGGWNMSAWQEVQ